MLLVITLTHDKTMHEVTRYVRKSITRLDVDENPLPPISYSWNGEVFRHTLRGVDLKDVTSVWYRIAYLTYLREKPGSFEMLNRLCREEMIFQLCGILEHAFWVSDPRRIKESDNKQAQLEVAQSLGMRVPRTLTTSSPEEAMRFRSGLGNIVVKPIAKHVIRDGRAGKVRAVFTNRILPGMDVDFSLLPQSPAIFQEEIDRQCDVRTVVVGDRLFSVSIKQVGNKIGDVDYRSGNLKDLVYERYILPLELERQCLMFVQKFGLHYSAMDFILGKDGNHYFLENNPCGAWLFVQNGGDHPIAQTLAELLE